VSALTDAKNTFAEHLKLVWDHVIDEEWLLRKVGAVTLQTAGLIPSESGIRVKDAIEAFLRSTDKPMLASRDALLEGLKQACKEKLIGIARGVSLTNVQRKWCGEGVVLDPNEEGIWIIPPFEVAPSQPARADDDTRAGSATSAAASGGGSTSVQTGGAATGVIDDGPEASRAIKRIRISGAVELESWADIFRCFVSPAARMNLKKLRLGIDLEIEAQEAQPLDQDDPALKAMRESARQLGLHVDEE
jgi:hypothetical protein